MIEVEILRFKRFPY